MSAVATRTSALVICGLGGQGVLFVTRVLGEAAIEEGRDVLTAETKGMAQRGGAVYSHLKFGPCSSPIVRLGRADVVLALDVSRRSAAEMFLAPSGTLIVNAPGTAGDRACCDAAQAATKMGFARGLNLVLLGFARKRAPDHLPAAAAILAAVKRLSAPEAFDRNRQALETGESLA